MTADLVVSTVQFGLGRSVARRFSCDLWNERDLEQVIVEFITGAKTRLDIAVQEIDSRAIAQAILDARWRGVRVQVFLEQDYLRSDLAGNPPKLPNAQGGGEPSRGVAAGAVAHR
jgi:hypothetical protein